MARKLPIIHSITPRPPSEVKAAVAPAEKAAEALDIPPKAERVPIDAETEMDWMDDTDSAVSQILKQLEDARALLRRVQARIADRREELVSRSSDETTAKE